MIKSSLKRFPVDTAQLETVHSEVCGLFKWSNKRKLLVDYVNDDFQMFGTSRTKTLISKPEQNHVTALD